MRLTHLSLFASLSAAAAVSHLVVLPAPQHPIGGDIPAAPATPAAQEPLAVMPAPPAPPQPGAGTVMLSDVLGRDRRINVFAGFTRDFAPITNRFDDASQNSTVLAPLNSAVEALPRKPWEDPRDYTTLGADAYAGPGGQERAQRNLRRFVEAHIVPMSPWPAGDRTRALVGDDALWWEMTADGKRVIQPGNIEVVSIASTVANGEVWIIKGVRNYAT